MVSSAVADAKYNMTLNGMSCNHIRPSCDSNGSFLLIGDLYILETQTNARDGQLKPLSSLARAPLCLNARNEKRQTNSLSPCMVKQTQRSLGNFVHISKESVYTTN